MGLFSKQLSNVVEWQEYRDDVIFWKWSNDEIKKGSRLIIRPGQDAVFLYNGRMEGIFSDEGNFEIESQIIPFLSTLKGFKFGFNSGLRAEVLFVNTKEFTVKWGTKNAINIPAPGLPGGMPIRAFGTFQMKVSDYVALIDQVAGVKQIFTVDDMKERVSSVLNQMIMKWIAREGKDMFNLQANADAIANGVRGDLDMQMMKIGISITGFTIESVNYPQEIQDKINKTASYSMVGDVGRYQQIGMTDAMTSGKGMTGGRMGDAMGTMVGMAAGMNMANQMVGNMTAPVAPPAPAAPVGGTAKCAACGASISAAAKFCPECGAKNEASNHKFCQNCGAKISAGAKFCPECGTKQLILILSANSITGCRKLRSGAIAAVF